MTSQLQPFLAGCAETIGTQNVVRDAAAVAAHTVDFWRYVEGRSSAVLRPGSASEVAAVVALAAHHRVPLVPQGGNTGLVGGGVPDSSGDQVLISLARLDRIRSVDSVSEVLVAEAGCTLAAVQDAASAVRRLFPLSLGSEGSCRIGGNVATNAGGVNVLRYGMTRDLVLGLEVVLADGRLWNGLSSLRKDNTGYDLKQLFIGAEGTLGIVTAASLRLAQLPRERVTMFVAIGSPKDALTLLSSTREAFGELVSSFELIAGHCVDAACRHLEGVRFPLTEHAGWYVLIELAWPLTEGLADAGDAFLGDQLEAGLVLDATRAQSDAQRAMLWRMREGISEALTHEGTIARNDVSVPIGRIPDLIDRTEALLPEHCRDARLTAFGHVGDGNLHMNVVLPHQTVDPAAARDRIQALVFDVAEALGGSISAEHGIGRLKRAELHARHDPLDIELMQTLKRALDPHGILNPGVIV